jgi:hypothetical protein
MSDTLNTTLTEADDALIDKVTEILRNADNGATTSEKEALLESNGIECWSTGCCGFDFYVDENTTDTGFCGGGDRIAVEGEGGKSIVFFASDGEYEGFEA